MSNSKIIDGITLSKNIIYELQKKIALYTKNKDINTQIVIIQIGKEEASTLYIKKKTKIIEALGIKVNHVKFPPNEKEEHILDQINSFNTDCNICGILLQLPIPTQFDQLKLLNKINAKKDIDGINPINLGLLFSKSNQCFIPPTAQGCIELLKFHKIEIKSKHVVIINRSNLIGKPLTELFLREDATVTICHSKTLNLDSITKLGDIVICAIGKPKYFTKKYFKEDATVIDVGSNILLKNGKNKTVGDVDFENVKNHVKYITPVPKSIGPLTISFLSINVFIAMQINELSKQ